MNRLFFLLFVITSIAFSSDSKEILIELGVSNPKADVYLCKANNSDHQYLVDFIGKDLDLSGRVQLQKNDDAKEKLFKASGLKEAFAHPHWERDKITSVIKVSIENNKINVFIFSVQEKTLKQISGISLHENKSENEEVAHKLSDAIHKIIFGIEGIATSKIIYALQIPDSKKPAKDWPSEIWMCNYDGSGQIQLTKEDAISITPLFFPPAKGYQANKILYVCYNNGLPKIHLMTLGETKGRELINLRGNQLLPAITRSRDTLAFISDAGGRADLFVQYFNPSTGPVGKPIQAYTFPSSVQASPTFSPDGSHIAFVSDKDGTPRVYVIETPTTGLKKLPTSNCLTTLNRENTCPSWSPDGTKLAYSAKTNGIRQIWIYDFSEQKETQLTSGSNHKENPCWAPNSLHLVYNTCDRDSSELFIINLNDRKSYKITSGPGKKHYPAWEQ